MTSKSIRSYLFAGLGVWLPILVTFAVIRFIVELLDQTIALLPKAYQPEQLIGMQLPGLGVLLSFLLLLATGIIATNFLGQRLVSWSESILDRIPLVRSIYSTTKQIIQTIFTSNGQAFRQVLLVEYPRKGMWSVAFQTGIAKSDLNPQLDIEHVLIFIPATPNPTAGFLMMVPKSDTIELNMTIDEAFKLIISLGVMQPSAPLTNATSL